MAATQNQQPERSERTVYHVREHGLLDVPLRDLLTDGELDLDPKGAGKYFSFSLKKQRLRLQAGGYIGFVPINERVAVDVVPRCPIANLGHILSVAGFAPEILQRHARTYGLDPAELPDLLDLYAEAFLRELDQIEAYGRLREYEQRVERRSSPRGRLLLNAPETQLAAAGFSASVRASWFERTADIPANRCLKMAIWLLARAYARAMNRTPKQRRLAARLNTIYRLFEDADLDRGLSFLTDPYVLGTRRLPSTRLYYRNAVDLARLIVSSSSLAFDRPGADVRMASIVIEMDVVFEDYVRKVLQAGTATNPQLDVLDGNHEGAKPFFDTQPSEDANPDIVFRLDTEETPVVMEVKYKPATKKPDRSDLNQVIAYGLSYRADVVAVVQPRAEESSRHRLISLGEIDSLRVYQYVFDLDADLDVEEAEMVAALTGLVSAKGEPATAPEQPALVPASS